MCTFGSLVFTCSLLGFQIRCDSSQVSKGELPNDQACSRGIGAEASVESPQQYIQKAVSHSISLQIRTSRLEIRIHSDWIRRGVLGEK